MVHRALPLVVLLLGCGDDGPSTGNWRDSGPDDADVDASLCGTPKPATCSATAAPTAALPPQSGPMCNPLAQTGCDAGEKCTWIQTPGVGFIDCAPAGPVEVGCACSRGTPGATGYDDCVAGAYCHAGICKAICDNQGGTPGCDTLHACVAQSGTFRPAGGTAVAGVCDRACDPLADNAFLGNGQRDGCACSESQGCYGAPSAGTPPVTAFTCSAELTQTLVHRSVVTGNAFLNSCAQGYLPLLAEETGSSSVICVAMCKPLNCYSGNCGANDENRHGEAPHRCNTADRRGTFDTSAGGEHCQFLWRSEVDPSTMTYLPSQYSDAVGFCYDHSKYANASAPNTPLPACAALQDGFGTGTDPSDPLTYYGAADLGCVDSTRHTMMANGKPRARRITPFDGIRPLFAPPRSLDAR